MSHAPLPLFTDQAFEFDPSLASPDNKGPISTPSSATSATNLSKPGRKRASSPETEEQADRRRRNNVAAAKYRQKKIDRISELEDILGSVSRERDDLKLQLAKRDAEVELLRRLLAEKENA